jgi:hypothetical protein
MTAAARAVLKAAVDRRRRQLVDAPPDGVPHGTHNAYKTGCRCDRCRAHQAATRRAWRAANRERDNAIKRAHRARKRAAA